MPILIELLVTASVLLGFWKGFVHFFWCSECDSPVLTGNVERTTAYLCAKHVKPVKK